MRPSTGSVYATRDSHGSPVMTKHYAHFNNEAKNAIVKALPSQKECVRVTVMQDLMSAQCPEWTLTIAQLVNAEQCRGGVLAQPLQEAVRGRDRTEVVDNVDGLGE
jgi:hypothetical protein